VSAHALGAIHRVRARNFTVAVYAGAGTDGIGRWIGIRRKYARLYLDMEWEVPPSGRGGSVESVGEYLGMLPPDVTVDTRPDNTLLFDILNVLH
jgi:hypothetical protein